MNLYTERHGLRKPITRTSVITKEVYALLLNTCEQYYKNLTYIFQVERFNSFVNQRYIEFDKEGFENRMALKIPELYKDEFGRIIPPKYGDDYDQYSLIDLIEYIAKNIKDISEGWNNSYRNYWDIRCLESDHVFEEYQKEINDVFREAGLLFTLTEEKKIERIVENTPELSTIEAHIEQVAEYGLKELMEDAIALYKSPYPSARQDSVEKIWDAFERLKTYYTNLNKRDSINQIVNEMSDGDSNYYTLFNNEFRALTDIGNNFRIRHHETDRIDISDCHYYDYFFNRCLSLIGLSMQYLK